MKFIATTIMSITAATIASVASAAAPSYSPGPVVESGGDSNGAIVLLLLVGAVILMNGVGTTRNTQQLDNDQAENDDDVLMKF